MNKITKRRKIDNDIKIYNIDGQCYILPSPPDNAKKFLKKLIDEDIINAYWLEEDDIELALTILKSGTDAQAFEFIERTCYNELLMEDVAYILVE